MFLRSSNVFMKNIRVSKVAAAAKLTRDDLTQDTFEAVNLYCLSPGRGSVRGPSQGQQM